MGRAQSRTISVQLGFEYDEVSLVVVSGADKGKTLTPPSSRHAAADLATSVAQGGGR